MEGSFRLNHDKKTNNPFFGHQFWTCQIHQKGNMVQHKAGNTANFFLNYNIIKQFRPQNSTWTSSSTLFHSLALLFNISFNLSRSPAPSSSSVLQQYPRIQLYTRKHISYCWKSLNKAEPTLFIFII